MLYQVWKNRRGNDHSDNVPSEILDTLKGKRVQKTKSYGSGFEL